MNIFVGCLEGSVIFVKLIAWHEKPYNSSSELQYCSMEPALPNQRLKRISAHSDQTEVTAADICRSEPSRTNRCFLFFSKLAVPLFIISQNPPSFAHHCSQVSVFDLLMKSVAPTVSLLPSFSSSFPTTTYGTNQDSIV